MMELVKTWKLSPINYVLQYIEFTFYSEINRSIFLYNLLTENFNNIQYQTMNESSFLLRSWNGVFFVSFIDFFASLRT